ncbi:PREDICTED: uncharacterized protein LOC108369072 [Rhagoletis zephyria]|uniref:uncharacterized protein LOC108369072 n=1 Tax=Rhagoletis zephyria TaxID=28612 RepID=UPI0008114058|nr:PREDICTED: uncharacterized protein LOC108369072 [Rhagoletis zephyria]
MSLLTSLKQGSPGLNWRIRLRTIAARPVYSDTAVWYDAGDCYVDDPVDVALSNARACWRWKSVKFAVCAFRKIVPVSFHVCTVFGCNKISSVVNRDYYAMEQAVCCEREHWCHPMRNMTIRTLQEEYLEILKLSSSRLRYFRIRLQCLPK